jgi:type II secretory pathway pseudopilin PulG
MNVKPHRLILSRRSRKGQAGLTLIELAVVMLILIGLATLVLPMTGGIVGKTHQSTAATTGAELFNQVQLYQAQKYGMPGGWDLLTDGAAPLNYLDNAGYTGNASNFAVYTGVGGGHGNTGLSLQGAGITTGGTGTQYHEVTMDDGGYAVCTGGAQGTTGVTPATCGTKIDATKDTFKATPAAITGATVLVTSNDATGQKIVDKLGLNSTLGANTPGCSDASTPTAGGAGVAYACAGSASPIVSSVTTGALKGYDGVVVLGVGQNSQMVGYVMQSAPIHFPDNPSITPNVVYSRFLGAFAVDSTGINKAKLIGIVHAPDTQEGWESLYTNVSNFNAGG